MIKLYHGDCLKLMFDLPDNSVDCVICDMPYGLIGSACKWDTVLPLDMLWVHYKRVCKNTGAIVLTASQPFTTTLISSNLKMFKYCWVWEKTKASNFVHANYQPLKVHEDVCIFSNGGSAQGSKHPMTYNKQMIDGVPYERGVCTGGGRTTSKGLNGALVSNKSGKRTPRSVFKISNPSGKNHLHPTQKPVELIEYLIKTYTNEGDTVLDNCMGSGTTGVACQNLNRDFIGIELDDKYFQIAKDRIEASQIETTD